MISGTLQNPAFNGRDGRQLENISDVIDSVNVLKATVNRFDDAPRFDTGKNKALFRQYFYAGEQVKSFYREQHEKQTVA